ncbi:hypothetical protein glysoja_036066 [Glycine soja]|uniref:Uncharacterized protein n=1 Tax=Glycine soja TaxID=3848 RepID=A0A0B2PUL7_GLYSO|nr:hypothetical protein glysoja_036066 [Glycine soja]
MSKDKVSGDPRRAVCTGITIFLLLAGVTLLVLWLVYRPHKPRFTEPGHNAAGSAATPVPGEAQLGFGVPGDRRHAAPGVGGGFERVGDGRGLWGGGSEADISGQSAVEGWGHQNCALWALR